MACRHNLIFAPFGVYSNSGIRIRLFSPLGICWTITNSTKIWRTVHINSRKKSPPVSGLNKRCYRCEGASNSQIRRRGQNELFCPLLASGRLSLTTTHAHTPKHVPLREHPRLDAKTTLHSNSFGLLKMCPCTSHTGVHLTLSNTPLPTREEVGNPAWVKNPLPVLSICKLVQ